MPARPATRAECEAFNDEDENRYGCPRRKGHHGPHHAGSGLMWGGRWRGTRTRAHHYSGHGGFVAVAALFLPRTWPPRLAFLACVLFSASLPLAHPFKAWLMWPAAIAALGALALIVFRVDANEQGGLFMTVIGALEGDLDTDDGVSYLRFWMVMIVSAAVMSGVAFLFFLVTNGNSSAGRGKAYPDVYVWVVTVLLLATLWLLFGVPNQAHRIGLDAGGYAQRILVGVITTAACILTGASLFLALYPDVDRGPLVAGIVFTTVLVAPFYKSLARVTWQRGLSGIVSPKALKEGWRRLAIEVRAAHDQAAMAKTAPEEP